MRSAPENRPLSTRVSSVFKDLRRNSGKNRLPTSGRVAGRGPDRGRAGLRVPWASRRRLPPDWLFGNHLSYEFRSEETRRPPSRPSFRRDGSKVASERGLAQPGRRRSGRKRKSVRHPEILRWNKPAPFQMANETLVKHKPGWHDRTSSSACRRMIRAYPVNADAHYITDCLAPSAGAVSAVHGVKDDPDRGADRPSQTADRNRSRRLERLLRANSGHSDPLLPFLVRPGT